MCLLCLRALCARSEVALVGPGSDSFWGTLSPRVRKLHAWSWSRGVYLK